VNGWLEAPSYRSRQYTELDANSTRTQRELDANSARTQHELATNSERTRHENVAKYTETHDSPGSFSELALPLEKRREEERREENTEPVPAAAATVDLGLGPALPTAAKSSPNGPGLPTTHPPVQTSILDVATAPQPASSRPADARSTAIREVFDHWKIVMGKSGRAQLDDKRKRRIEWAIKHYGLSDAKAAIDGCALSSFHMGRDKDCNGKLYNELDLIFRDASHAEKFIALSKNIQKPASTNEDPPNYDPARHGKPKSIANFAKWNAYLYGDKT
jgi:hypothetical protein